MGERDALLLLAHAVEPGDAAVGAGVRGRGAQGYLDALREGEVHRSASAMRARLVGVEAEALDESAAKCDARIVTRVDREWPGQLDALGDQAPFALWVRGVADLRLLGLRSVAVVGARACTPYGSEVAHAWSAGLADAGWTVLSGAAFGIDAAAHRGALAAGGATVAVLAGGVDVPYPRAHAGLIDAIADDGLVVSETPPGQAVRRQRFLSRNRVIAALTRATLVVEAAERSGTRATARVAAALARPVLAVPGPVTSPASAGCHRMVREGEGLLVADLDDVLELLDLTQGRSRSAASDPPGSDASAAAPAAAPRLTARQFAVVDAMPRSTVIGLDALMRDSGLPVQDVLAVLPTLVAGGWVREADDGWRLVRRSGGERAAAPRA